MVSFTLPAESSLKPVLLVLETGVDVLQAIKGNVGNNVGFVVFKTNAESQAI